MSGIPHVVYGVDSKYVPPLLVSIYSMFTSTPGRLKTTIFTTDPDDEDLREVQKLAAHFPKKMTETVYFDPKPLDEYERARRHHWSSASMIPLFVPWLVAGRCILLDADTIILRDIGELYRSNLNGCPMGSVQSSSTAMSVRKHTSFSLNSLVSPRRTRTRNREIKEWSERVGFTLDELQKIYFASGTLLLDTDAIRKIDRNRTLCDVEASRIHWNSMPDMDRYNEFFKGNCEFLDLKWNVYRDFLFVSRMYCDRDLWQKIAAAGKDPAILHYPNMFTRKVWKRPWYKSRNRHRVYRSMCHKMQKHTRIPIFEMLNSR